MPVQSLLDARVPQRPRVCESLEPRRLFAAAAELGPGGLLTVVGTHGDDHVELQMTGESRRALRISVTVNGVTSDFRYGSVRRILIVGGAGNDRLGGTNWSTTATDRARPMTVLGGAGNDSLSASANNDRLDGGQGDDTLEGGQGNDVLLGRAGSDLLIGFTGSDTLRGGAGDDRLDGNGDYREPFDPGPLGAVLYAEQPGNGPWNDAIYGGPGSDTFFSFDKPGEQKDVTAEDTLV
jgi:Ca2+-binding RTX toxin-like protein